ncbi:glutathione S-transferase family protein [Nevskia sp.]|uniref:glutathione S-transferase family protein n=1 Tax=Nevskia sp. TaxID=1929292 RepID=UPI0025E50906|nr:glutathione S-transferase family protein [Nevskia sp.]
MNDTIELHGTRTGNCFRVAIALEEAGLAYRVVPVDLAGGEHQRPEHLALNPAGKVPTIVASSPGGQRLVLSQSNAILLHLAERAPGRLLPDTDPAARALALERYLYFVTDVIAPSHSGFFLSRVPASGNGAELLNQRSLDAIYAADHMVGASGFISGDRFGLADIAALTMLLSIEPKLDWARIPRLQRWLEAVRTRPAVIRGFKAFDPS